MRKSDKKKIIVSAYANSFEKRVFDLVVASVGFLFLWPIFLIIGFIIFFTDGWPVIFSQKRVGKDGKVFVMYKFRTMVRDAESLKRKYLKLNEVDGPVFKIKDDPRFVGVGKRLARSGLDELPQLWNVLKGEMSLVGPRPLPVDEAKSLTKEQRKRHLIRPGITSTWVVEGAHYLTFHQWNKKDHDYIQRANLRTDISVLVESLFLVVKLLMFK